MLIGLLIGKRKKSASRKLADCLRSSLLRGRLASGKPLRFELLHLINDGRKAFGVVGAALEQLAPEFNPIMQLALCILRRR